MGNTIEKPPQQSRIVGCQILNNKVGLQANKCDIVLTVLTVSINRQMKERLITSAVLNLLHAEMQKIQNRNRW